MNIQYQYFPKSCNVPTELQLLVNVFFAKKDEIISSKFQLPSNEVLRILSSDIAALGYQVETGKKAVDKIKYLFYSDEMARWKNILRQIATIRK